MTLDVIDVDRVEGSNLMTGQDLLRGGKVGFYSSRFWSRFVGIC